MNAKTKAGIGIVLYIVVAAMLLFAAGCTDGVSPELLCVTQQTDTLAALGDTLVVEVQRCGWAR